MTLNKVHESLFKNIKKEDILITYKDQDRCEKQIHQTNSRLFQKIHQTNSSKVWILLHFFAAKHVGLD